MIVTYILIYWIIGGPAVGGGFVTGQATFADKDACDDARQAIADAWATRGPNGVYGVGGGRCMQSATPAVPGVGQ